jgi:DNA adenine methylase
VINDVHAGLMNFFAVLADPQLFPAFVRIMQATPVSERGWESARDRLAAGETDPVLRAAYFMTLCRQSRDGKMRSFAPATTHRRNGMQENASAWLTAVDGLPAVHERLRGVVQYSQPAVDILRTDGRKALKTTGRESDRFVSLFYCDPPYVPSTRAAPRVYEHEMSYQDHEELVDALLRCTGHVMLSGFANALYDDALKGWNRHTFDTKNRASGGAKKAAMQECLWTNF